MIAAIFIVDSIEDVREKGKLSLSGESPIDTYLGKRNV